MAGAKRGCLAVLAVLLLGALLLAGAGAWFWHSQRGFADAPLTPDQPSMVIASGDGLNTVLGKLRAAGVDEGSDTQWQLLARQLDAAGKLKVGEYALDPSLTPRELLQRMREGRTLQYRFTIVEGWNIRQLRAALRNATPLQQKTAQMSDAELMAALGHAGQHPEGRFLPETYVYTRSETDLDVLKRAYAAMEKAVDAAWQARAQDIRRWSARARLFQLADRDAEIAALFEATLASLRQILLEQPDFDKVIFLSAQDFPLLPNALLKRELVERVALDQYAFVRDAYLKRRASLIRDGAPDPTEQVYEDFEEESSSMAPQPFPPFKAALVQPGPVDQQADAVIPADLQQSERARSGLGLVN